MNKSMIEVIRIPERLQDYSPHRVKVGMIGQIIGERQDAFLAKLKGKSGPVSFAKDEVRQYK